ncbi:MAG: hypothetical protein Q4A82_07735 [Corynebacterium sp.]|nr:hypothetical protein [Corynebacterium sp.]
MKNRLLAAVTAVALLVPIPAVAQTDNPYTITFANGVCTFGFNKQHPEGKLFLADSGFINRSHVFEVISQDVPAFAKVYAANPEFQDRTDAEYLALWNQAAADLKAAGYTDSDVKWIGEVMHKRGVREPVKEEYSVNKPLTPAEAAKKIKSRNARGVDQHYARKMFIYHLDEDGKVELSQYWLRKTSDEAPLPVSEKITGLVNSGFKALQNRAGDFAGYRYDIVDDCAKLEAPITSSVQPTASSVQPITSSVKPKPADGVLTTIYTIINSVIGFLFPWLGGR